jgi:hypothetical protein
MLPVKVYEGVSAETAAPGAAVCAEAWPRADRAKTAPIALMMFEGKTIPFVGSSEESARCARDGRFKIAAAWSAASFDPSQEDPTREEVEAAGPRGPAVHETTRASCGQGPCGHLVPNRCAHPTHLSIGDTAMKLRHHRFSVALQAPQFNTYVRAARDWLNMDCLDQRSRGETVADQLFMACVQLDDDDCVVHDGWSSAWRARLTHQLQIQLRGDSSAMLSFRTFTRGSPMNPSSRPSVFWSMSPCT